MTESESFLEMARVTHLLREPALRSAIEAMHLSPGSRGLDAGCGIGLQALMLAESVGPEGHVTGVDLSSEFLVCARETASESGFEERLSFTQGDVQNLPYDDDTFDWVWSADCVGYAPIDPVPLVQELARVTRAGGTVAILAWTHETLLPGHPYLEARLRTTPAGIAPFERDKDPGSHFLRALGWFRGIGLKNRAVRTFAAGVHAPLTADLRSAVTSLIEMRWPAVESELSREEAREYKRLCRPESPDFVADHPDYYAFFTYSMFLGTSP